LKAYKQFMELKKKHRDWDGTFLSPPLDVERMWHQHTQVYEHYPGACEEFCGRVISHGTTDGMDFAATAERIKTTQNSIKVHFYSDYDKYIWSFKPMKSQKQEEEDEEAMAEEGTSDKAPEYKENNESSESRNIEPPDQKPEIEKPSKNEITLVIKYPGDEWALYNVPDNTRLEKIFDYFAKVQEKDISTLQFKYGDREVKPHETPRDCNKNAKKVVIEVTMDETALKRNSSDDSDFGDCVGFCTDFSEFVTLQKQNCWPIKVEW